MADRHHAGLLAITAVLSLVLAVVALQRTVAPSIELDRPAWRCTAEHVEKVEVRLNADGGAVWDEARVCDAWGRR